MLVTSLVIFFSMARRGGAVRMCSKVVQFRSSLVSVVWHRLIPRTALFHTPRLSAVLLDTIFGVISCIYVRLRGL